jgi:hypothetical protein
MGIWPRPLMMMARPPCRRPHYTGVGRMQTPLTPAAPSGALRRSYSRNKTAHLCGELFRLLRQAVGRT